MNRSLTIIVYVVVFLVSFTLFFVAKLPVDAIIGHYLAGVEDEDKGGYRIMMGKRQVNLLFDSRVEDLHIQRKTDAGYVDLFYASKLQFSVSYVRALMGDYSVSFNATLKQGKVAGEVFWSDNKKTVQLNQIKNLTLSEIGILREVIPVDLSGTVNGEVLLSFAGSEPSFTKMGMKMDVKIGSFQMAETPLKDIGLDLAPPNDTLLKDPIPRLLLSGEKPAWIDLIMDQGRVQINRVDLTGDDVSLRAKGKLSINTKKTKGAYTGNMEMTLKISKQLESDYEQVFATFENEKDAEGAYKIIQKGDFFSADSYTVGKVKIGEMLKSLGAVLCGGIVGNNC